MWRIFVSVLINSVLSYIYHEIYLQDNVGYGWRSNFDSSYIWSGIGYSSLTSLLWTKIFVYILSNSTSVL